MICRVSEAPRRLILPELGELTRPVSGHCHAPGSRPGMAGSYAKNPNTFARGRCLARLHNAVLIHPMHLKDLLRDVQPAVAWHEKPTWINSPARQLQCVRVIQAHWRVKIRNSGDPRLSFTHRAGLCRGVLEATRLPVLGEEIAPSDA